MTMSAFHRWGAPLAIPIRTMSRRLCQESRRRRRCGWQGQIQTRLSSSSSSTSSSSTSIALLAPLATNDANASENSTDLASLLVLVGTTAASMIGVHIAQCEEAPKKKGSNATSSDDSDDGPEYTADQVSTNNGKDGKPVWMTYAGKVYDVTSFVSNHPGGDRLLLAAGGPIEPHWHLYRQHFASDLPMRLLEPLAIGNLRESDQDAVDEMMEEIMEKEKDPYEFEPERVITDNDTDGMRVHSDQPMNAEVPEHLLTRNYLTPSYLYYIRHHHPVPYLSQTQIDNYRLEIDLSAYNKGKVRLSLDDLKSMPKEEIVMTMQCSGNRRSGYNVFNKTSGTTWGQGAISTAKWGGVRLSELLKNAGMGDPTEARDKGGMEHVQFGAVDGMKVSIGIEKATNPYGDVMVCYEMNGEDLPRDHGYPIRLIVPGYAGVRSLKWLNSISISNEEAEGPWQRGLNYKVLPPNVHDANEVDVAKMPSCNELSVSSGITTVEPVEGSLASSPNVGDVVVMRVSGWAFAGGGRNIVRVDVTGDVSNHAWQSATLKEGSDQRYGRGWAWTFWEADVPAKVQGDGSIHIYCKGVDMAFNSQPESAVDQW
eukprot:CAMPEP_0183735182 /NCGR_PEP_ID=MMETSP0737-20130205/45923_1 /TAXON_ID=385413 /ORGANISM="Thalassiosira miniscula, Strain CCMP1093" /LENGTH=595 /DNA_ID=CAMNT_0025968849 /DNA_START=35 /DNA_END=1819 /DNA_ORIENTATION=+